MSSIGKRPTQPGSRQILALVTALASGLGVFAVQVIARHGEVTFAAAVAVPVAVAAYLLTLWQFGSGRAQRGSRSVWSPPSPGRRD